MAPTTLYLHLLSDRLLTLSEDEPRRSAARRHAEAAQPALSYESTADMRMSIDGEER